MVLLLLKIFRRCIGAGEYG